MVYFLKQGHMQRDGQTDRSGNHSPPIKNVHKPHKHVAVIPPIFIWTAVTRYSGHVCTNNCTMIRYCIGHDYFYGTVDYSPLFLFSQQSCISNSYSSILTVTTVAYTSIFIIGSVWLDLLFMRSSNVLTNTYVISVCILPLYI